MMNVLISHVFVTPVTAAQAALRDSAGVRQWNPALVMRSDIN